MSSVQNSEGSAPIQPERPQPQHMNKDERIEQIRQNSLPHTVTGQTDLVEPDFTATNELPPDQALVADEVSNQFSNVRQSAMVETDAPSPTHPAPSLNTLTTLCMTAFKNTENERFRGTQRMTENVQPNPAIPIKNTRPEPAYRQLPPENVSPHTAPTPTLHKALENHKNWDKALEIALANHEGQLALRPFAKNIAYLNRHINFIRPIEARNAARKKLSKAQEILKKDLENYVADKVIAFKNAKKNHNFQNANKILKEVAVLRSDVADIASMGNAISKNEVKSLLEQLDSIEKDKLSQNEFQEFYDNALELFDDSSGTTEQKLADYLTETKSPWLDQNQASDMHSNAKEYFDANVMPKIRKAYLTSPPSPRPILEKSLSMVAQSRFSTISKEPLLRTY